MPSFIVPLPYRGTLTRPQYEAGVRGALGHPMAGEFSFVRFSRADGGSNLVAYCHKVPEEDVLEALNEALAEAFDKAAAA